MTRRTRKPMFRLTARVNNIDALLPPSACGEMAEMMIEMPDGTLCPCTEGPSGASSSTIDNRTRAALNGSVMDGLYNSFDAGDPLSQFTQVADAGNVMSDGAEDDGPPPLPYEINRAIEVWNHLDLDELDKKALDFFNKVNLLYKGVSETGEYNQKIEYGSQITADWNPETERFEGLELADPIPGTVDADGMANAVSVNVREDAVAHLHTHPPHIKGKWVTVDALNRKLSPPDRDMAQLVTIGGRLPDVPANRKRGLDSMGFGRKLVYYLAGPDGHIRRFTHNGRFGDGELVGGQTPIRYYTDAPPPYSSEQLANPEPTPKREK